MDERTRTRRTLADRFWPKVAKAGPAECWLWTASVTAQGYGQISRGAEGPTVAHRVSFEIENGPIPAGMHIDHACGNRLCVNPAHLRLATPGENAEHRVRLIARNRSGYRGVSWDAKTQSWSAQVYQGGKKHHLGRFSDPAEAGAAAAAKRAELYRFPDFPGLSE